MYDETRYREMQSKYPSMYKEITGLSTRYPRESLPHFRDYSGVLQLPRVHTSQASVQLVSKWLDVKTSNENEGRRTSK